MDLVGSNDPNDFDDGSGASAGVDPGGNNLICGGAPMIPTVSGANAAAVGATAMPAQPLPACPTSGGSAVPSAPFVVALTSNADPAAGPFTDTVTFDAPVTLWDPSDNGGDPSDATFVIIVHVGPCPVITASANFPRRVTSASQRAVLGAKRGSSRTRRPLTGIGSGIITVYALPVLDGQPRACTTTSTPTPAPPAIPPAPNLQKTQYTASLLSRISLPMNDAAVPAFGVLTWAVSGDTDKFPGFTFTSPTTAASPHADSLQFSVPATTRPGDYTFRIHVTSSTFGTTSTEAIVTLRVLPPVYTQSTDNTIDVFEIDAIGKIVTDKSYQTSTTDDGTTPDFGLDPAKNPASGMRAGTSAVRGSFNPLSPPQAVVNKILYLETENKANCESVLVIDNVQHDPGSGSSPAVIRAYGYCRPTQMLLYSPAISWLAEAFDINSRSFIKSTPLIGEVCKPTAQVYRGIWGIGVTRNIPVQSVTGYSEFHKFRYLIELQALNLPSNQNPDDTALYPLNSRAVIYPKVASDPTWGTTQDNVVPFPFNKLIHYCPEQPPPNRSLPGCFNKSDNSGILGRALTVAGFARPASNFQAHHILQTVWGGDDTVANGVWLPSTPAHQAFTNWWNPRWFVLPPAGPQTR